MGRGKATVIVGAQWGDEGKGKVVDVFSEKADVVVRFQGGANAGHTLVIGERKEVMHVLPSGIVRAGRLNLLGPGVVVDLEELKKELVIANRYGALVGLDRSAPIVHPLHKLLDSTSERGADKIGTTSRGIGPAYGDVIARSSVKLGDLTSRDKVRAALLARSSYEGKVAILMQRFAHLAPEARPHIPTVDELVEWCLSFEDIVKPRLCDSRADVLRALDAGKRVLFEGAQGVMLDVYQGQQPFTTSSSCSAACVSATFGIYEFDAVIGITKAYTTRVGEGPFPAELLDSMGETLRQLGGEFGATTGRPRRCGWLDLVALRYACRVGGITHLIATKLDVLEQFSRIGVCDGYIFEGAPIDPAFDTLTTRVLTDAQVHTSMLSTGPSVRVARRFEDLPAWARGYLHLIEQSAGVPIIGVGVGAEREAIILR